MSLVVNGNMYGAVKAVPFHTPETIVPTEVREELTTLEAKVVPVRVPAGAITALPVTDVTNPLPLAVIVGIEVEDPTGLVSTFTVAKVSVDPDVVASPDRADAAVTNPFPFTVTEANEPTFEFTVARVDVALPGPEAVTSPMSAVM
jgi:hypothetical protein